MAMQLNKEKFKQLNPIACLILGCTCTEWESSAAHPNVCSHCSHSFNEHAGPGHCSVPECLCSMFAPSAADLNVCSHCGHNFNGHYV